MYLIEIPPSQRKKTTISMHSYFDALQVSDEGITGFMRGRVKRSWKFSKLRDIRLVKADLSCQFAQIVLVTDAKSGHFSDQTNFVHKLQNPDSILICSGPFSHAQTNAFAASVLAQLREAFETYASKV